MTYEEFVKKVEEPPVVDLKLTSGDEFHKVKYVGESYVEISRNGGDKWYKFELQGGRTLFVPFSSIAGMIR